VDCRRFAVGLRILSGLWIIPILAVLIIVHEFGHFGAARLSGVKVEEFGIGLPPRIRGWERNGVLWSLNAIPFGGFVRVKGEDANDMSPDSMNAQPPLRRAFFLAAGSGMNIVLALVLMVFLVGTVGEQQTNTYINQVVPGTPAEAAGLEAGDRVIRAAGERIDSSEELIVITNDHKGRELQLTVLRDGQEVPVTLTPRENPPAGQGPTGVVLSAVSVADVYVDSVEPGSLAAAAGLQAGDQIVAVSGAPVTDDFVAYNGLTNAQGQTVTLTVEREGQELSVPLAVPLVGVVIDQVQVGEPAGQAGWRPTDRILAINGEPVTSADSFANLLLDYRGMAVPVLIERPTQGETFATTRIATTVQIPNFADDADYLDALGIEASIPSIYEQLGMTRSIDPIYRDVPAAEIIPTGFQQAWEQTRLMVEGLVDLFTGGADLNNLAGPIGMGQLVSETLEVSPLPAWVVLTNLTILLSLNLAVLNLLPLPALDGGRLLFVLIEILRGGKRVSPEREGLVHLIGLVLLLVLMFVVAFGDIQRIISGDTFF
jgi:regulator of sigma E protease